jgi:hypothetical protein
MKKHNGGAITAICDFITDKTNKDYYHTSTFVNIWVVLETFRSLNDPVEDLYDSNLIYQVYLYSVGLTYTRFEENMSGVKGTAV